MPMRGENVRCRCTVFNDASTAGVASTLLYDDNNNLRVLASNERFVLTDCQILMFPTGTDDITYIGGSSTSTGSTNPYLAGSVDVGTFWQTSYEGMSFPVATVPWVFYPGSGSTLFFGTGYILNGGGYTQAPLPYLPGATGPNSPILGNT